LYKVGDVVTLNCPLHPETEYMINNETLKLFRRGAYLVNTAHGKLCDRDSIARSNPTNSSVMRATSGIQSLHRSTTRGVAYRITE
jgi:hypothetical protein